LGDEGGVGAGFKGGAVADEALVAVGDDPLGFGGSGEVFLVAGFVLGVDECLNGVGECGGGERAWLIRVARAVRPIEEAGARHIMSI
jgi:hypothetical protein